MVWYDVAKQNATNESMQANPVLKDFSGNGHDAACYNFAWSGMSGIGGYNVGFRTNFTTLVNYITCTETIFTAKPGISGGWIIQYSGAIPSFTIKVTGLTGVEITYEYFEESNNAHYLNIKQDGIYTIPESVNPNNRPSGFRYESGVSSEFTIEILPQYPGALVYDGVDDYAIYVQSLEDVQFPGYTMMYKAIVFRDKQYGHHFTLNGKDVQIATVGNYLASKVERNNSYGTRTDFPEKPEYYNTVRTVYQSTYSFDGIQDLNVFEENIPAIGTDHDGIRLGSALGGGSVSKIVLYSFILFDRDLTPAEIEWVKTNLIEQ